MLFSRNSVRVLHRLERSHDSFAVGARCGLAMTLWPTLPDPRERFIAQVPPVMREICLRNKCSSRPVRHLRVNIGRSHDPIHIANENGFYLKRAKLAMPTLGQIIAAGFDRDKSGEEKRMHSWIRAREVSSGFLVALQTAFTLRKQSNASARLSATDTRPSFCPSFRGIQFELSAPLHCGNLLPRKTKTGFFLPLFKIQFCLFNAHPFALFLVVHA